MYPERIPYSRQAAGGGPRLGDLITLGEDDRARYLLAADPSGDRIAIVVARPLPDADPERVGGTTPVQVLRAEAASRLTTTGIAPVREVGLTPGGHPFVSSALGDGLLLSELRVSDHPPDAMDAIGIVGNAARIVAHAHAAGIPHGSLGGRTIGIDAERQVFVHGFGIATGTAAAGSLPVDDRQPARDAAPGLDRSGSALERLAREDVAALCRLLDTKVTSETGPEGRALLARTPALAALLARGESLDEPMTASELADDLQRLRMQLVRPEPVAYPPGTRRRQRRRRAAAIALLVALPLALVLLLAPRLGRDAPEERREVATASDTVSGAARDLEPPESGGSVEERVAPATSSTRSPRGASSGETVSDAAAGSIAGQERATGSGGDSGAAAVASGNVRQDDISDRDRPAESSPPRPDAASATPTARATAAQVPAGTTIDLTSDERICTNTHLPGHRFSARVSADVRSGDGVAIPAGSRAVVVVTSVDRSENSSDLGTIGLAVQEIVVGEAVYPVDATITSVGVERSGSKSSGATAVVGGAVAGAILGQVIGKDTKSTVVGAAAGAAAGSVIAMSTGGRAGCLPYRGPITVRLNSGARVVVN